MAVQKSGNSGINSTQSDNVNVEESFVYVKFIIASSDNANFGIILLKISSDRCEVETIDAVYGLRDARGQSVKETDSWTNCYEYIAKKKFSSEFNAKLTTDLINTVTNVLRSPSHDNSVVREIIGYHEKKNLNRIRDMVFSEISRILFDKHLILNVDTEFILLHEVEEFMNKKTTRDAPEKEKTIAAADNFFVLKDGGTLIPCAPLLGPVTGVPIFTLKAGQEIMIRIDNTSELGNKYNNYFNLIDEDGKIRPIKARIAAIKSDNEGHKLLVHIQESIYGKIVETEQIKVKLFAEDEDQAEKTDNAYRLYLVIGIVFALVVSILLVRLFFG